MGRLAAAHLGLAGCDLQDQDDDGRGATDGRGAADGLAYPDARNEPGSVTITATTEQVAATADLADDPSLPIPAAVGLAHQHTGRRGPISSWLLSRLACDAVLQRVLLAPTGAVLDLGRRVRLATPSQKRALAARDGGCVIPTCAAPPEICDTHHIVAWSSGGPTDLDNLASLCPRHHTAVHAGHWLLSVRDGTVWAAPPAWIDPKRRPLRNTTHQTARAAQALGEQLRLLLDRSPRGQDTGDP
jgi:hypothetical protein